MEADDTWENKAGTQRDQITVARKELLVSDSTEQVSAMRNFQLIWKPRVRRNIIYKAFLFFLPLLLVEIPLGFRPVRLMHISGIKRKTEQSVSSVEVKESLVEVDEGLQVEYHGKESMWL